MSSRKSDKNSRRKTYLRRLKRLRALGNGSGWVLNPIQSEREDWSECVRGRGAAAQNEAEVSVPEDPSDEFDSLVAGFKR